MKNHAWLNKFLSQERKTLYMVLSVLILSIFTLTMAYAALSTTLNINGNAEVTAASWDIYLDNVQLNRKSATDNVPTISNKTTASFSTTLSKPGEFYEFTIDVVNDGTIDAMIESITKTPSLTEIQAKYLNYIVEYQNGESISTKQLLSKKSFVKLKVRVEFRKDVNQQDLPSHVETLDLSFNVNYVQADENASVVKDNGVKKVLDIVSGDLNTVGSEICIGEECFYLMKNDGSSVTMLAKYNLYVGGEFDSNSYDWTAYGDEATGLQNPTMLGSVSDNSVGNGTTLFSSTNYWSSTVRNYPAYVYDSNSAIYNYVENYKSYLVSKGAEIEEARLIKIEELESLGCSKTGYSCLSAPEWIYGTSYWVGDAHDDSLIWCIYDSGEFQFYFSNSFSFGVRPVIVINI